MDNNTEKYFFQGEGACFQAVLRSLLYINHGILTTEDHLVKISNGIITKRFNVRVDGTDSPSIEWCVHRFNKEILNIRNGTLDILRNSLDLGLKPIVHRPSLVDGVGHYILVYGYNKDIKFFDPAGADHGHNEENPELFYERWYYPNPGEERWAGMVYDPKMLSKHDLEERLYKSSK